MKHLLLVAIALLPACIQALPGKLKGHSSEEIIEQNLDKKIDTQSLFSQNTENNVAIWTATLGVHHIIQDDYNKDNDVSKLIKLSAEKIRETATGYRSTSALADWLVSDKSIFKKTTANSSLGFFESYGYHNEFESPADSFSISSNQLKNTKGPKGNWNINIFAAEMSNLYIGRDFQGVSDFKEKIAVLRRSPVIIFNGIQEADFNYLFFSQDIKEKALKKYLIIFNRCESEGNTEEFILENFARNNVEVDLITVRTKVKIRTFNHTNAKFLKNLIEQPLLSSLVDSFRIDAGPVETIPVWISNKDRLTSETSANLVGNALTYGISLFDGAIADSGADVSVATVTQDTQTNGSGSGKPPVSTPTEPSTKPTTPTTPTITTTPPSPDSGGDTTTTPPPPTPDGGSDTTVTPPPPVPDGDGDTPIVLDGNDDGKITRLGTLVKFDINANGAKERLDWISSADYFLALDLNLNGIVDNGSELFGNHHGTSSIKPEHGFAALAKYDSNNDQKIDAKDPIFSKLKLWQDKNGDGISTADEMTDFSNKFLFISTTFDNHAAKRRYLEGSIATFELLTGSARSVTGKKTHVADIVFDTGLNVAISQ